MITIEPRHSFEGKAEINMAGLSFETEKTASKGNGPRIAEQTRNYGQGLVFQGAEFGIHMVPYSYWLGFKVWAKDRVLACPSA